MLDVSYMTHHGSDDLVVDAARVSFSKQSDNYGEDRNRGLINFLAREKHLHPFSHPVATFRCSSSIFVARQLAKHQVGGTWNEESRRYIKTPPAYWKPKFFRAAAANVKQGSSPEQHCRSEEFLGEYHEICIDAIAAYNKMVALGICAEQARAILPQGVITEWVWTGSLLFWSRVYNLRIASDTQEETRDFADLLGEQMASLYPISWEALTDG
jgi:thymidylate synthase (FAD)|tara:strand:- start:4635 stop:5273 length:639 start_codon:yes stop_codon:yes gene_type:complete